MFEKELRVLPRDANGKRAADQLLSRPSNQTNSSKINLFSSTEAIKRDVPDWRKVEKIHITLNCLFHLVFWITKTRRSCRLLQFVVIRRIRPVADTVAT